MSPKISSNASVLRFLFHHGDTKRTKVHGEFLLHLGETSFYLCAPIAFSHRGNTQEMEVYREHKKRLFSDLFSSETIGVLGQSTFGLMRVVSYQ
jgi:hypothetical protein